MRAAFVRFQYKCAMLGAELVKAPSGVLQAFIAPVPQSPSSAASCVRASAATVGSSVTRFQDAGPLHHLTLVRVGARDLGRPPLDTSVSGKYPSLDPCSR